VSVFLKIIMAFILANAAFCSTMHAGRTGLTHKETACALRLVVREADRTTKFFEQGPRERVRFVKPLCPDFVRLECFVPSFPRVSIQQIDRHLAFTLVSCMMVATVLARDGLLALPGIQEHPWPNANAIPPEFAMLIRQSEEPLQDPFRLFLIPTSSPIHTYPGILPQGACLNKDQLQRWIDASELSALPPGAQICCEARPRYTFECCLHSQAAEAAHCGFVRPEGVQGDDSEFEYDARVIRRAEEKVCTDLPKTFHVRDEALALFPAVTLDADHAKGSAEDALLHIPSSADIDKITRKNDQVVTCNLKVYTITNATVLPTLIRIIREIAQMANVPMPEVAIYDDVHCPRILQRGYSFRSGPNTNEVRCSFELLKALSDEEHAAVLAHEIGGHESQYIMMNGPLRGERNTRTGNNLEAEADMYRTWLIARVCDQLGWDIDSDLPVSEITRDNADEELCVTDDTGHPSNLARQVLGLQFKHALKRYVFLAVRTALKKDVS
jgi:hypothetical protein